MREIAAEIKHPKECREAVVVGVRPMLDILLSQEMPRHMFEAWLGHYILGLMEIAIREGDDYMNGPVAGRPEEKAVQDEAVREAVKRTCS